MPSFRPLQVRDCQGTLWAFLRKYEGQARISFEGDLQGLHLDELPSASFEETPALRRQTISPRLDFVVVSASRENINSLKTCLSKAGVLGRNGTVIHTQIEVGGELIFLACDNFHDDCTAASPSVTESFLAELKSSGALRNYGDA